MSANELFGDAVIVGILILLATLPLLVRFYPLLKGQKAAGAPDAGASDRPEPHNTATVRFVTRLNNNTMVAVIALVLTYTIGFIAIQVLDDIIEENLSSAFEAKKIIDDTDFKALKMEDAKLSPVRVAELDIRGDEGVRDSLNHDKSYIHILRGTALALFIFLISMAVFLLPKKFSGTSPPTRRGYVVGGLLLTLGILSISGVFEENREAERKYEMVVYHLWKENRRVANVEAERQLEEALDRKILTALQVERERQTEQSAAPRPVW